MLMQSALAYAIERTDVLVCGFEDGSGTPEVAKGHGRPLANGAFLKDNGKWLNVGSISPVLPSYSSDMPKWVSKHFKIDGSTAKSANFVVPVGDILVSEQPIGDAKINYIIRSVYQSSSRDGGKTWSEPILTPHSYIFEIGRRIENQSFVGRPVSYEGQ